MGVTSRPGARTTPPLSHPRSPNRRVEPNRIRKAGRIGCIGATTLVSAGLPVVIVNPRQVRDFAKATGKLAKTDAIDAAVLAHFAQAIQPEVRPLPDADAQALAALVDRRRQLLEIRTAKRSCTLL